MTNSADADQFDSKQTDLDLHCLLRQGMSCLTREGLNWENFTASNQKGKENHIRIFT